METKQIIIEGKAADFKRLIAELDIDEEEEEKMNNLKLLQNKYPNSILLNHRQTYTSLGMGQTTFYKLLKNGEFDKLPKPTFRGNIIKFNILHVAEFLDGISYDN